MAGGPLLAFGTEKDFLNIKAEQETILKRDRFGWMAARNFCMSESSLNKQPFTTWEGVPPEVF